MIPKGLFAQIAMVALSIGIIVTYVKPSFAKLGAVQDDVAVYSNKRSEVAAVNAKLATLVSRLESLSRDDQQKLNTYMPDSVDYVSVPRDLLFIVAQSGVLYKDVSYVGPVEEKKSSSNNLDDTVINKPQAHKFTLAVEGTYDQIKSLFSLMEQNNYPLEVENLDISLIDGGFLSANINLVTYSYHEPEFTNKIVF